MEFKTPILTKKVRDGVYAYKYHNGVINICGQKYIDYSMTEAISRWREKNPKNNKHKQK